MSDSAKFDALVEQGKSNIKHRNYDVGIDLLMQACQLDADQPVVYEAMGTAYALSDRIEQAIEQFLKVVRLNPRQASTYVNLSALYNRVGNFQQAIEMSRKAVQIDRKSADGYYNLGLAHRKLGQHALAIPAYREAIRINPQMSVAHQNLGNVFLDMGNAREAIIHFEKALQIDPGFTKAQVGLDKALDQKEHRKTAYHPFGRLVEMSSLEGQAENLQADHFRILTDEERVADREALGVFLRTIARSARNLREQLKLKLVPESKELDRLIVSGSDCEVVAARLKPIANSFQTCCRVLSSAVDELRAHEQRMQVTPTQS